MLLAPHHRAFVQILNNHVVVRIYDRFGIAALVGSALHTDLPAVRAVLDDHADLMIALRAGETAAAARVIFEQSRSVRSILLGGQRSGQPQPATV
jgi:DNA-binding GntR family transcriptional regulator